MQYDGMFECTYMSPSMPRPHQRRPATPQWGPPYAARTPTPPIPEWRYHQPAPQEPEDGTERDEPPEPVPRKIGWQKMVCGAGVWILIYTVLHAGQPAPSEGQPAKVDYITPQGEANPWPHASREVDPAEAGGSYHFPSHTNILKLHSLYSHSKYLINDDAEVNQIVKQYLEYEMLHPTEPKARDDAHIRIKSAMIRLQGRVQQLHKVFRQMELLLRVGTDKTDRYTPDMANPLNIHLWRP